MRDTPVEDVAVDHQEIDIKPGDLVRLTSEALINPKAEDMKPMRLFKNEAWPNEFLAHDVFEKDGKWFLRLDPCCGWMRDLEDRTKLSCQAHPAHFFERSGERIEEPDEETQSRYSGVKFNGEDLLGIEYDGKAFVLRYMGRSPLKLDLAQGKEIEKLLHALKII